MKRIHRYAVASALCAALAAPPVASAVLIPIPPDKPAQAGKRQVVRKAKPQRLRHVLPVRNKPALSPEP